MLDVAEVIPTAPRRVLVLTAVETTPIRQVPLAKFAVAELPEGVELRPLEAVVVDGHAHAWLESLLKKLA